MLFLEKNYFTQSFRILHYNITYFSRALYNIDNGRDMVRFE